MKKLFLMVIFVMTALISSAQVTSESADLYARALKCYENNDKEAARRLLTQVVNMASTNPDVRERAKELLERCQPQAKAAARIDVSEHNLNFAADGDFKEFTVTASGQWRVVETSPWCEVVETTRNYLKLWCQANPRPVSRSGMLVLSCNGVEATVYIHQDPGKEKKGRVYFRTTPHNAYIEVSDGSSGYSSSPLVFGAGEYSVRISKEGYEPKDTTLIFEVAEDTTRVIDVALNPLFGKIAPVIVDEDGNPIENVDFRIGRMPVDIYDYANGHSFDDKETIVYYGFYKEGVIPLNPGGYEINVAADGYQSEKLLVNVCQGETHNIVVQMKSILGNLVIKDGKGSEGAQVYIPELRLRAHVGDTLSIPVGQYQVEVIKENYMLDSGILDVKVEKGLLSEYTARMTRMVEMQISTEGGGERVYVNNTLMKNQEPMHVFSLTEGEEYKVEIRKEGHWRVLKEFKVSQKDTLFDFRNIRMEQVDTLWIDSDDPSMLIQLRKKSDPKGQDYALGAKTPTVNRQKTELYVPYGKYRLKLIRDTESKKSRRVAYKGNINFTERNDHKYIRTWMVPSLAAMRFISAEGMLSPMYDEAPEDFLPFPLKVGFFELPICKGLSTTVLKGSLVYTKDYGRLPHKLQEYLNSNYDDPYGYGWAPYHYTDMMPAISGPLMNYDFRIGGGLFSHADLSLLVSYTYYLEFENLLRKYFKNYGEGECFDHFEGHDLFAGVELGTRFKGLNFYLRAGFQYLKGNRLYYYMTASPGAQPEEPFVNTFHTDFMPLEQTAFVVNLGIDIGGRGAKGQNILRIF